MHHLRVALFGLILVAGCENQPKPKDTPASPKATGDMKAEPNEAIRTEDERAGHRDDAAITIEPADAAPE